MIKVPWLQTEKELWKDIYCKIKRKDVLNQFLSLFINLAKFTRDIMEGTYDVPF